MPTAFIQKLVYCTQGHILIISGYPTVLLQRKKEQDNEWEHQIAKKKRSWCSVTKSPGTYFLTLLVTGPLTNLFLDVTFPLSTSHFCWDVSARLLLRNRVRDYQIFTGQFLCKLPQKYMCVNKPKFRIFIHSRSASTDTTLIHKEALTKRDLSSDHKKSAVLLDKPSRSISPILYIIHCPIIYHRRIKIFK